MRVYPPLQPNLPVQVERLPVLVQDTKPELRLEDLRDHL